MTDSGRFVTDIHGARGELLADPDAAAERVAVRLDAGPRVRIDRRRLAPQDDGGYRYEAAFPTPEADADTVEEHRIPVARERATVRHETRETGRVRIVKQVHEEEETIEAPLREEAVSVERVPVGRVVETAPATRQEGDVLVIPVVEERLVVTKELVLKEEIRVTRQQHERSEAQQVTLRREEVRVEREGPSSEAEDAAPH